MISYSIESMANSFRNYRQTRPARLSQFLLDRNRTTTATGPIIARMSVPILEVIDVRKRYGKIVAVDGVSLSVNEGEMFGLLGPNGAGKTTLISILSGLKDADGGEVRLFGKPFTRSDRELRRLIGIG